MRSICFLGVQVAVEGNGWMVLAINNYDYGRHILNVRVAYREPRFKLCMIMKRF